MGGGVLRPSLPPEEAGALAGAVAGAFAGAFSGAVQEQWQVFAPLVSGLAPAAAEAWFRGPAAAAGTWFRDPGSKGSMVSWLRQLQEHSFVGLASSRGMVGRARAGRSSVHSQEHGFVAPGSSRSMVLWPRQQQEHD